MSGPDRQRLTQRVTREREELGRIMNASRIVLGELHKSQIPRMAAALAYRTLFGIIPVLAIGLLVFGALLSESQVEQGVKRVLSFAGIDQIVLDDEPDPLLNDPLSTAVGSGAAVRVLDFGRHQLGRFAGGLSRLSQVGEDLVPGEGSLEPLVFALEQLELAFQFGRLPILVLVGQVGLAPDRFRGCHHRFHLGDVGVDHLLQFFQVHD